MGPKLFTKRLLASGFLDEGALDPSRYAATARYNFRIKKSSSRATSTSLQYIESVHFLNREKFNMNSD